MQRELLKKHEMNQRNINYRMLKNKGLTRKRKREDRNPRVKLKNKFKRAEKKRKVREADTALGEGGDRDEGCLRWGEDRAAHDVA